jgi:NAD(P)-dependent dehydrogenase (short-subunit alcohol dehydrogenase family)
MNSLFSLKGKVALLTGGGRGIGAAVSAGLRDAGARVAVFEYDLPKELPKNIKYYKLDISNGTELDINFKKFLKDFNGIDILVNNAAVTISSPSEEYKSEAWHRTVKINLSSVFFMCQLAGRQMIKQGRGGSIINITSIGAAQGFPNNPGYVATKGGVKQLTKALAYDWGKYGIRVNNLAPGYTHTPMNQKSWEDPELRRKRQDATMLGRWAEPEDMVGPSVFLASDASRYITGIDLYVDGGWIAKGI